jgi:hypothetical protein
MTTNRIAKPANITPDDVEFVPADELAVGDIIVSFTANHKSVAIPPTQRQLNAARTTWTRVNTMEANFNTPDPRLQIADHSPKPIWEINRESSWDNGRMTIVRGPVTIGTMVTCVYDWRVKRSFGA